jgi:uncharacterized membrane protein
MNATDTTQTNVIAVSFTDDDKAYAALAELKQLDSEGLIGLREAAVVTRDGSARLITKDSTAADEPVGTATGGILDLLLGVLGGPLGVLIGGTTGLLTGSLYDLDDADATHSTLAALSGAVRAGGNTLLAELREPSQDPVDSAMAQRSGTVLRRDAAEVEAELAAADAAEHEARRQARKRLRDERVTAHKAAVDAKVAELKARLVRRRVGESSSGLHTTTPTPA